MVETKMGPMYSVGDRVRIKSREWFMLEHPYYDSISGILPFCGMYAQVIEAMYVGIWMYRLNVGDCWYTHDMIEGVDMVMGNYPQEKIQELIATARLLVETGSCREIGCSRCPASTDFFCGTDICDVRVGSGGVDDLDITFFKEFLEKYDSPSRADDSTQIALTKLETRIRELESAVGIVDKTKKIDFTLEHCYVAIDKGGVPRILIRMGSWYAFFALSNDSRYGSYNGRSEDGQAAIDSIQREGHIVYEFEDWAIGMGYFMSAYRDAWARGVK